jgi:PAS domain S-box-containing protein
LGSQTHTGGVRDGRGVFLLSLIAVCAVAAVDLAVGQDTVLVELLLIGPVVAAFGATPGQTAIVALFALAIAIPLGLTTDDFGSTDQLIRLAAVGLVSGLAVGIARLRSDRERDTARLAVQYGVARVLAEADSLESAGPLLLEAIAEPMGWDVAHLWEVRGSAALRATATWMRPGFDAPDFERATRQLVMGHGFGLPGAVWESGMPAWFTNVLESDKFTRVDGARSVGLRGALAFPIRADGRCVAVIELFAREEREPDPDLLVLTDALGSLIGEFVEGVAAAEAVRQSEAHKTALFASSLDAIITIDHVGNVVEFNRAAERMFGRTAEEAVGAELAELIVPPALRERHRAALRRFAATRRGTLLGKHVEMTGMRADGSEFPVELAINLIAGTEPPMFTGTVRDITSRRRADDEREEWLRLEQVARLDATQARDQLQAILSGVADAVTAQAPDGRLLFANDAALELLGFESIEELQAAPGDWMRDRFEVLDEEGNPLPTDQLPGRRALAGEGDAEMVVRFRLRATGEERWSAVKATPILDEDGFVTMAINVIEDITTHKRAERAQRFLADSSALLGASLEPVDVLGQVATLAVPEVADWVAVHMPGDSGIELVALAHRDPERLERAAELDRAMPTRQDAPRGVANVIRTGQSELYPDVPRLVPETDDEHARAEHVRAFGMRSALVVPMTARGRTLGALTLATDQSGRRFDEQDTELAEELARRCATAIDNARLFAERAYIARTLQQSLLPAELPDIPGIEAAARFRPTGEGNEVGGDFYDLFESGGRGWTVVMGDVCGKGPDAAAVTALARYTLRAAAMRERLPSRSLGLLNEALLRQRDDRRFCTVAYAYLEPRAEGARIGFASGGHPLPLLLRADGSVQPVGEPGTLLGVVSDPTFEDRSLSLSPGDALVFYTDGVIEGRGGNSSLDENGLARLVAACAGAGADAIAAQVEDAAVEAQDGSPRDDIAVLVLRVAP